MAFASHIVTVRRLKKYIDDVIGKKANLPDTSKTIVGNIDQLNSDLMELSDVQYASWRNTSVSGGGQGSNALTLSKGKYLVIGQAPYTQTEYTAGLRTDDSSQTWIAIQSSIGMLNMSAFLTVTNDSTAVWVANFSSATITYQDIFRGYIKAIRLGD